jgi:sterol desaturase/sphingolipid hydroxylase (fatty acid hydroxylase superfamily)
MQWSDLAMPHMQNLAWSATLVTAFAAAELRRSEGYRSGAKVRVTNFLIGTIVALFGFLLSILFDTFKAFMPVDGLLGYVIPGWRPAGVTGVLVSILVYGLVWDFFQYWFHRLQHELAVLWPSHRVHHSDDAVNASTALRRSVPELALIFLLIFLPTALVAGIEPVAAWFAFAVFYSWGFFNHADISLPLGAMTPVFSGPQWHRLHHGIETRNCNYAAFFPVLDILFGTYRAPRADEVPTTGIADPLATAHPIRDCVAPRYR